MIYYLKIYYLQFSFRQSASKFFTLFNFGANSLPAATF